MTETQYDIKQLYELISRHYQRKFEKMSLCIPSQIVDGGVAEFVDEDSGKTLATTRIRMRNRLDIDSSGQMKVDVRMSDVVFARPTLSIVTGESTEQ